MMTRRRFFAAMAVAPVVAPVAMIASATPEWASGPWYYSGRVLNEVSVGPIQPISPEDFRAATDPSKWVADVTRAFMPGVGTCE